MKEDRFAISNQKLDFYVAQAKQLRAQEISRIFGQLFRLPQRLVRGATDKATAGLANTNVNQSA
ncbi:MAG: hypothetical protein AB8B79_08745 [Granulosicoccus sp.]